MKTYEEEQAELERKVKRIVLFSLLGVVVTILLLLSVFIVPAGNIGVITRWGAVHKVAYPGIGLKMPISDGIVKMSVRTQKDEVGASAASKDLQVVTSTIAVNYHLDGSKATKVYEEIGKNYADIVVAPAVQNTFKAVTAKFTAEQLITQRESVRIQAEKELAAQLIQYNVVVENFNIINFDFSPEFNAAIEAKQVAQQQVETAKQTLLKAEVDAQSVLAQAKGQADAQALLKNTGALSEEYLRYLALTKWDGRLPSVTGGVTPFIDVEKFVDSN